MRNFYFLLFIILFFVQNAFCDNIVFSARTMSGRAGSKEDTTTLSGKANVVTNTIEIKADSIELSGKDFRYVTAKGNISGVHKESNLEFSGETLKYDRETKVVTFSGDVNLYDIENKARIKAQIIEYDSNTDIAILQIGVHLEQKKNVCTSAYAVYRKKEQMLELNGSAKVVQEEDTFSAQTITFNMDTEEIVMEGNVRGSVTDDRSKDSNKESDEEKENQTTTANNPPADNADGQVADSADSENSPKENPDDEKSPNKNPPNGDDNNAGDQENSKKKKRKLKGK